MHFKIKRRAESLKAIFCCCIPTSNCRHRRWIKTKFNRKDIPSLQLQTVIGWKIGFKVYFMFLICKCNELSVGKKSIEFYFSFYYNLFIEMLEGSKENDCVFFFCTEQNLRNALHFHKYFTRLKSIVKQLLWLKI